MGVSVFLIYLVNYQDLVDSTVVDLVLKLLKCHSKHLLMYCKKICFTYNLAVFSQNKIKPVLFSWT